MSEADIAITPRAVGDTAATPDGDALTTLGRPRVAATGTALSSRARWAFSFPAMLGVALIGRVFYEARGFVVDPDFWWHVTVGQGILATHRWPTTDPYSFTVNGHPWIAYEWLGDVAFGAVARWAGVYGLAVMLIVLSSVVVLALYAYATMRSGNSKAGFLAAGLLCSLAFASFSMRPQMFGYLFLILVLIALERFHQGKKRALWFLPLLFLVWVNVHGSFIIGMGALFMHLVAGLKGFRVGDIETRRWTSAERMQFELVFLLSLAVLPLTPYGTQLAVYPFDMAWSQPLNVSNILEWQPMPFNIAGGKLFLGVVLGFFLAQMALRLTWRLAEVVLLFVGILMACLHVRFLLVFVPFFAPLFATVLARWLPPYQPKKDRFVLNAILIAAAVVAMIHYLPTHKDIQKIVAEDFPVDGVEYLRAHPVPRPMFNTYGFGGYLVYAHQTVFLDGRGDLYERGGVLADYLTVSLLRPGALSVLERYQIQSCMLARGEPLAVVLDASPRWKKLYTDNVSVIFVRR
jgi:hypothetical protein